MCHDGWYQVQVAVFSPLECFGAREQCPWTATSIVSSGCSSVRVHDAKINVLLDSTSVHIVEVGSSVVIPDVVVDLHVHIGVQPILH